MTLAFGADHGGYLLKQTLIKHAEALGHSTLDFGTDSPAPADYPLYAQRVGLAVHQAKADYGILICKSGVGIAIAANKMHGIRAGEVRTADEATTTRHHNDTNVIVLGANHTDGPSAIAILDAFLAADFEAGGRHERRVCALENGYLGASDPEVAAIIEAEERRQTDNIELIASENFTSAAVREAQGSVLTNKYAEGYPGRRWYGGCEEVDKIEQLAIDRALALFGGEHANVQPHSGSQANTAVYYSVLKPGDRILTMDLAHGGHLTHGHPANFSGKTYAVTHYGVAQENERIDYDALATQAQEVRPAMITAGASAYPRIIDWERMAEIAQSVNALLFVDMAHIAGLVAAGQHPNPVPHADFVTTTTHKSLRGPRGGIIICKKDYAKKIDAQVFPGIQGGPLMHVIAAKAVCLGEALRPDFKTYQAQVIKNAQALAQALIERGYRIVSGGTDNHLMLVDLRPKNLNGAFAQERLDQAGITVNKNAIPFDSGSPMKPSGIRLGTPAVTSRSMTEEDMEVIAAYLDQALNAEETDLPALREEVHTFTRRFPLP